MEFLNSIHVGNAFQTLRGDLDKKQIRYAILPEETAPLESGQVGAPFEVIATVKRSGLIVERKEVIVLDVDAGGKITKTSCKVFLTGP